MRWHKGVWACVYKWAKVKSLNGNAKSFVCVREMKSLEILNQIKQIIALKVETLNKL